MCPDALNRPVVSPEVEAVLRKREGKAEAVLRQLVSESENMSPCKYSHSSHQLTVESELRRDLFLTQLQNAIMIAGGASLSQEQLANRPLGEVLENFIPNGLRFEVKI